MSSIGCETILPPQTLPRPQRQAIELRIALMFTLVFLFGLAQGYPINVPDAASVQFAQYHFFAPLLLAFALQLPLFWLTARKRDGDPLLLIKALPFVALVILLHFNFKAWMPLVNRTSYDAFYQTLDELWWPIVAAFCWLREAIQSVIPFDLDGAYHGMFVGMFFVAFAAHAVCDTPRRQRQLLLGMCLILLLGGVLYWVAPAVGPFVYREGLNDESTEVQAHMLRLFHFFVSTGEVPPGYFTAPLAAMPSLHVAHGLFFTLFAWRSLRWLFWIFLPLFIWIVLESVASGWHYLADLPVGACLAVLSLALARGFIKDRKTEEVVPDRLPASDL